MANQIYNIFTGDFKDANNKLVKIKIVFIGNRSHVIIDDIDFSLQGNISDVEAGTTGSGAQIIELMDSNGNKFELDVTDQNNPTLTPK